MPNIATQLYRHHPSLQVLLDFLGRCEPDGQRLVAHYQNGHELDAVQAACANAGIHPAVTAPAPGPGKTEARPGLVLDRADWLALANNAIPLLAQELRLRLPAIGAALKLVPVQWRAMALANSELAAWGAAAGMVALPKRAVFDYLGSRYPGDAEQRRSFSVVGDVRHAANYRKNNALGFLIDQDGTQNLACHADDWSREVSSATTLVNHHLALMLKIGLQMLEAGVTSQLKDLCSVLLLASEAPLLVKLQTLLGTVEDHVALYGADQHGFRDRLLTNCVLHFDQWQIDARLVIAYRPAAFSDRGPVGSTTRWEPAESGGAAAITAPASVASSDARVNVMPASAMADPIVDDGITIPPGITVARGAHVRVFDICAGTRLKPGTVWHGDVAIASHTSFDGPVTIMNDVRVGRGLKFGSGLILAEGATISTFAVASALPHGTRIAGNLRIGDGAKIGSNVSFGAENWIGERVHIGDNVRLGNWVRVDSDVSIGANARIEGPARLVGDVPEHTDIAGDAMKGTLSGNEADDHTYALSIPQFTIAKNGTVRQHPATPRKPLAPALHSGSGRQQEALTGGPRKRGTEAVAGGDAKRTRTDLESRYKAAESGRSPARVTDRPNYKAKEIAPDLPSSGKVASGPVAVTSTARPDIRKTVQDPPRKTMTPVAAALKQAPQPSRTRSVQREDWQTFAISKEQHRVLEQVMRQSIRIPAGGVGSKPPAPLQAGEKAVLKPLYDSKGPRL